MWNGKPRGTRSGAAGVVAVAVPAAVMLAVGLWGLDRGGAWRDEAVTLQVARRSVPQIWRLLHGVDAVHGLYYLLMHVVLGVRATGEAADEVVVRLPSVVGAAVAAGLVAALGARLARPRVGLWAGLLYAVTPLVGHYAQEGRSYALVAAGAAGATLWLTKAVAGRPWWPYAAVVAVTCLLHELAVLLLLAHAVTLALWRVPRRVWGRWAAASGAVLLVVAPLVLVSRRQAAQVAWLPVPGTGTAERLLREFTGPADGVYWACVGLAVVALAAGRRSELVRVALPLAVVPPLTLMAVSQVRPVYDDRYVLYALAGAPLLVAAGADRLLRSLPRAATPAGALAVTLAGVLAIVLAFAQQLPLYRQDRTPASRPDNLAAVSAVAARELGPGDPVVFLPSIGRRSAMAYPKGFRRARDIALKASGPVSGTLYGREVGPSVLRQRLDGLDRLWVVAESYALSSSWRPDDPAERLKLAVVTEDFVPREPRREYVRTGVTLRLYVRRASLLGPLPAPAPRAGPLGVPRAGVRPPGTSGPTRSPASPPAMPRPAPW